MLIMITVVIQMWLLEKWINYASIAVPSNLRMKHQECAVQVEKWNCQNYIHHPNHYQMLRNLII